MSIQLKSNPAAANAVPNAAPKSAGGNKTADNADASFSTLFDNLRAGDNNPASLTDPSNRADGSAKRLKKDDASLELGADAALQSAYAAASLTVPPTSTAALSSDPNAAASAATGLAIDGSTALPALDATSKRSDSALASPGGSPSTAEAADPALQIFATQVRNALAARDAETSSTRSRLDGASVATDTVFSTTATRSSALDATASAGLQAGRHRLEALSDKADVHESLALDPTAVKTPELLATDHDAVSTTTPFASVLTLNPLNNTQGTTANSASGTVPGGPLQLQRNDWAPDLSQRIDWMRNQNISAANISVNPEHLGPIKIHIEIRGDITTVSMTAQQSDTRELLSSGLPQLQALLQPGNAAPVTTQVLTPDAAFFANPNPNAGQSFQQQDRSSADQNSNASRRIDTNIARSGTLAVDGLTNAGVQRGQGLLDTFA